MRRALRWTGYALAGLVGLALIAAAVIYVQSERIVRRTYDVASVAIGIPTDNASVAEGERLARIRGCYDGCHGPNAGGRVFFDEPGVGRLVAPNLTRVLPDYTDAELTRLLRHGIRKNGRSVWAMPSSMFGQLSDADLGRIIAFMRSRPEVEGPGPDLSLGPLGRLGVVLGQFKPEVSFVEDAPLRVDATPGATPEYGRYLALSSCSECHGHGLEGHGEGTPSLRIVGLYSIDEFRRLMRTGVPRDGRDLELMDDVARSRFANFTDDEVKALYGHLSSLDDVPGSPGT